MFRLARGLRAISSFQDSRFQHRQYDYLRDVHLSDVMRFRKAIINNHEDVMRKMMDDVGYHSIGLYLCELASHGYGRESEMAQRLLRRLRL